MTKFENIGVQLQQSARNVAEAQQRFEYSCECCTSGTRCLYCDCDHCAIATNHHLMVALLRDLEEVRTNE